MSAHDTEVTQDAFGVIELKEAFASQSIAVLTELGMAADDPPLAPTGFPTTTTAPALDIAL